MTKLTEEAGRVLVAEYLKVGFKGMTPLAKSYGVSPSTVRSLALRMGHSRRKSDPRWERAIAVGRVEA